VTSVASPHLQLLLEGRISLMLWRLAAPNVAAVVIMSIVTIADAWFVGKLGTAPLASLALVFPFQTLMVMVAGGAIGGAATSSVARTLGSGSKEKAEAAAWHALIIAGLMSIIFLLVLAIYPRQIFALLGGTGEALNGAVLYSKIAFGGSVSIFVLWILAAILRGTGDTITPARVVIIGSVVQVILSGALTHGWGALPKIGIAGPATAMVVCHSGMAIYLAMYLIREKSIISLRVLPVQRAPLADIMNVGGVGLVNSVTVAATVIVVTGIVGHFGTEALAGYGLGSRLELMLIPIIFGIGAALTAAVGANIGAGQHARARRIAWAGAGISFFVICVIGVLVAIFPGLWLGWFTADPAAYAYGSLYLGIVAPFYGVFGAGQALYFASQGTGRMILPVSVGVVRFLVVVIIGVAAIRFSWSLIIVFAGVSAGLVTIGLGLSLCLLGPDWRPNKLP